MFAELVVRQVNNKYLTMMWLFPVCLFRGRETKGKASACAQSVDVLFSGLRLKEIFHE